MGGESRMYRILGMSVPPLVRGGVQCDVSCASDYGMKMCTEGLGMPHRVDTGTLSHQGAVQILPPDIINAGGG